MGAATHKERPLHFLRLPEIEMMQILSIVKKMIDYPGAGVGVTMQQHYTIQELSERWNKPEKFIIDELDAGRLFCCIKKLHGEFTRIKTVVVDGKAQSSAGNITFQGMLDEPRSSEFVIENFAELVPSPMPADGKVDISLSYLRKFDDDTWQYRYRDINRNRLVSVFDDLVVSSEEIERYENQNGLSPYMDKPKIDRAIYIDDARNHAMSLMQGTALGFGSTREDLVPIAQAVKARFPELTIPEVSKVFSKGAELAPASLKSDGLRLLGKKKS